VQEASCHVREPWQRINSVVRRALAQVTLADLVTRAPSLDDTFEIHPLGSVRRHPGARQTDGQHG
jgi:DNA-binding IscR family transcriptional regulator